MALTKPINFIRQGRQLADTQYFDSINQSVDAIVSYLTVPGPYANDAAAAAAGVQLHQWYYLASGAVVVRLV